MSGYLVDTNVLSAGAPGRRPDHADVLAWMERHTEALYLSVITVTEIEAGIAKATRKGPSRKAEALRAWWDTVEHLHGHRILPVDHAVARMAGVMTDRVRGLGHAPGLAGITIAATARTHGLTLLTRNLRHFAPFGIAVLDPFDPATRPLRET